MLKVYVTDFAQLIKNIMSDNSATFTRNVYAKSSKKLSTSFNTYVTLYEGMCSGLILMA